MSNRGEALSVVDVIVVDLAHNRGLDGLDDEHHPQTGVVGSTE